MLERDKENAGNKHTLTEKYKSMNNLLGKKIVNDGHKRSGKKKPYIREHSNPLYLILLFLIMLIKYTGCEAPDRFYRPDMPERLCCISMIDIDTSASSYTTSYIYPYFLEFGGDTNNIRSVSFEKSYQSEYPEELNDSLRDFSFTISSSEGFFKDFQSEKPLLNPYGYILDDSISFSGGEKIYIHAKEKDCPDIYSEVTVPERPADPELISVEKEYIIPNEPVDEIWGDIDSLKSATIKFSFNKNDRQNQYFALIMDGIHLWKWTPVEREFSYFNFSVKECNAPGFFARWHGLYLRMYPEPPEGYDGYYASYASPVNAYFIDGNKIPGKKCIITLSTQFHGLWANYRGISMYDNYYYNSVRIRIMSIPVELYKWAQSLYYYDRVTQDPFSEPVNITGNIKGGNGVFAVCRSKELIVEFNPRY